MRITALVGVWIVLASAVDIGLRMRIPPRFAQHETFRQVELLDGESAEAARKKHRADSSALLELTPPGCPVLS